MPTLKFRDPSDGNWKTLSGFGSAPFAQAKIAATANQSVAGVAVTVMTAGQTFYDTSGIADLANNRLVIPFAGYWRFHGRLVWASNATGQRAMLFTRGASEYIADSYIAPDPTNVTVHTVTTEPILCSAGDAITLGASQGSGAALNLQIGNGKWSFLACEYIGPIWMGGMSAPAADTGWINFPAPLASATVAGATVPGYRRLNGITHLRGALNISATVLNQYNTVYTLPAGFRPIDPVVFATQANTTTVFTGMVTTAGAVQTWANGSTASWFGLGNVHFPADQ